MKNEMLSIVIGTYNRKQYLKNCIKSIELSIIDLPYEIIVVDGGSDDGTIGWLKERSDIIAVIQHSRDRSGNLINKWGYFINLGFRIAHGRYVCMISDDCYLHPNAIKAGMKKILNDRSIGGVAFFFRDSFLNDEFRVSKFDPKYILINHGIFDSKVLSEIGFANEDDYLFYCADQDLSLKIWNSGYKIVKCEECLVEHLHLPTDRLRLRNIQESEKFDDENTLFAKWGDLIGKNRGERYLMKDVLIKDVKNEIFKHSPITFELIIYILVIAVKQIIGDRPKIFNYLKKLKFKIFKI